jgi:hypothetical protein
MFPEHFYQIKVAICRVAHQNAQLCEGTSSQEAFNIFDLRGYSTAQCRLREVDVLQLLFGVFLFERVSGHQMHLLQALEELISELAYYSTITSELRSIN